MMNIDYATSKVLIVDDNPANIDILLELLQDFDVRAALDGESALEVIADEAPDLILLDIVMPGIDGFSVCQRLKANEKTQDIPIIFLSSNADESSIVQGFEVGGVDYIKKPYLAPEVLMRVKTHLKLQQSIKYMEQLAHVDELTGISNRRRFFKHASALLSQAKQRKHPLHLFVFDIDLFKQINDTYGHAIGDEVLRNFTRLTRKTVSRISCFARFGGDEFVMLISNMNSQDAYTAIDTLREVVFTTALTRNTDVKVSLSVGMASLEREDETINSLIAKADEKLYMAKETRNALVI